MLVITPTPPKDLHYMLRDKFYHVNEHLKRKGFLTHEFSAEGFCIWRNSTTIYALRIDHLGMPVLLKIDIEHTNELMLYIHLPSTIPGDADFLLTVDWF